MKLAFITGITGQDGSYLSELLIEKHYKVYGIVRRNSILFSYKRLDHIREHITLYYGDMTDGSGLLNTINKIVNENKDFEVLEIYNLAAQSHVKVSFEIPEYTADVDGIGVLKLLEIVKMLHGDFPNKIKFYQAGTSEMYGKILELPQNEETPFNPISPYAAAKVYAYYMTKIYREGYGLFSVNGILFNHESPRRGDNFLTMKVIKAVNDIFRNKKKFVELGNLESKRDWGHAKDYVKGMWLMLQKESPNDYVLATGITITVREFVEKAFLYKGYKITWMGSGLNKIGMDQNGVVRIKINPKYYRPCEVDLLLGDSTKAKSELDWKINYDIDKLIEDMFTYK